jgi:putative FmdB family regulatory protein
MPIYEYRCPNGHLFEVFHGMTEPSPAVCEVCGEGPLERVLHPVAVHFKGSGFYTTDYGRGKKRADGSDKEGASKEGASKDTGSKDIGSKDIGSSSGSGKTAAEA